MLEFLAGFALGLWVGSIVSIVGIIYLKRRGYIASPSEDLRPIKRQVDELNKWREESESKTSTEWNRIKALEDGLQLLSKHNEMTETVLQGMSTDSTGSTERSRVSRDPSERRRPSPNSARATHELSVLRRIPRPVL